MGDSDELEGEFEDESETEDESESKEISQPTPPPQVIEQIPQAIENSKGNDGRSRIEIMGPERGSPAFISDLIQVDKGLNDIANDAKRITSFKEKIFDIDKIDEKIREHREEGGRDAAIKYLQTELVKTHNIFSRSLTNAENIVDRVNSAKNSLDRIKRGGL